MSDQVGIAEPCEWVIHKALEDRALGRQPQDEMDRQCSGGCPFPEGQKLRGLGERAFVEAAIKLQAL